MTIATGPGPRWVRRALAVLAVLYFIALLKHPPQKSILRPIAFFTESTKLFPSADTFTLEFRLEGWSCPRHRWEPLDERAYFPIEADDKESKFQRLAYFYVVLDTNAAQTRTVMRALDEWIEVRHPTTDDGVEGPIGGIRLYKWAKAIPDPGATIDRYVYRPMVPPPADERKDMFYTKTSERKARCGS